MRWIVLRVWLVLYQRFYIITLFVTPDRKSTLLSDWKLHTHTNITTVNLSTATLVALQLYAFQEYGTEVGIPDVSVETGVLPTLITTLTPAAGALCGGVCVCVFVCS